MTNSPYFIFPTVLLLWILCTSFHEFGHALVAYYGGDYTVSEKGYLYLNPFHYATLFQSLLLPILLMILTQGVTLFGAAVYINVGLLRSRGWQTATSLGGPLCTLFCLIFLAFPFYIFSIEDKNQSNFWSAIALSAFLQLNALIVNLIPLPPLDGFMAILPWLPLSMQQEYDKSKNYINVVGLLLLYLVVCRSSLFNSFITNVTQSIPSDLLSNGIIYTFPQF